MSYPSAPVPITVANVEAMITSPASGAVVYGNVTITTTTTPSCETLDIYLDGVPIVPNLSCSGATVSSNWITSNFGDGPHVLTAEYFDGLTFGTSPPGAGDRSEQPHVAAAQVDITSPTTNATIATQATIVATVAPGTTTVGFYLDSYYTPVPTSDGSATTGLAVAPGVTTMQVTWDASHTSNARQSRAARRKLHRRDGQLLAQPRRVRGRGEIRRSGQTVLLRTAREHHGVWLAVLAGLRDTGKRVTVRVVVLTSGATR